MRRRTISNQSHGRINSFGSYFSNSASGQYSPDPSEEAARLLESQEEIRTRSFSTFSNRNWIPATTINAQIQQNNNSPPQSVIITIPPQSSQIPQTMNTEEFVSLHGNYSNYPSLPRSEISSILEQLSSGNYIPRENRPWDLPPQYPIYYRIEGDEEIGVSLCRNMPQLLPPPPYSDFNVAQPSLPTMPMPTVNLHNNRLPHNTPVVPPPPLNLPSQRVNDSLSSARILGVPVLPPAFENGIFANQVRRSQNRRNRFNEENERLFKKRV
uniref:Uncharacterized protein n=1 Tax=Panagrolaimus sp. PS1159 TaxID=55785 RepID=A0AC35GJG6_9BILA